MSTQGPSVQAVVIRRKEYVLWTKISKDAAVKRKEVVVSGKCNNVTNEALVNKIVHGCSERVERVQVSRKGEYFRAWIVPTNDKVWEFIEWFNCRNMLNGAQAAPNSRMRATHDVVLVGAGKSSVEEIIKWAGRDNVCGVELRGNSAIVSTIGPSFADVLLGRTPMNNTTTRKYVHRTQDPIEQLKRNVSQLQSELNNVMDDYARSVEEIRALKAEMMKMRHRVSTLLSGVERREKAVPDSVLEMVDDETMNPKSDEQMMNTPVAQTKGKRTAVGKERGQTKLTDFTASGGRRGTKRVANELEEVQTQSKVVLTGSPGGTMYVNKTQPIVENNDESEQLQQ